MNRITNSAAMLVTDKGSSVSKKIRIGLALSIFEASTNSFGTVGEEPPEQQRRGRRRDQRQTRPA